MIAGTAPAPNIQRQPVVVFQSSSPRPCTILLTNNVRKIPMTMPSWNKVPSRPRHFSGEISAIYTGQIIEDAPMPRPPMKRAARNSSNVRGTADSNPERAYRNAHRNKVRRRPRRSLNSPANIAPGMQPRIALAPAIPSCVGLRCMCAFR